MSSNDGLQQRYRTERTDGSSAPGGKHHGCPEYVLDLKHDPHARVAMRVYIDSCRGEYPRLAKDLEVLLANAVGASPATEPPTAEVFATVREVAEEMSEGNTARPGWRVLMRHLSLLERRMGAQEAALRYALTLHHRMPGDVIERIQAALTDAPPSASDNHRDLACVCTRPLSAHLGVGLPALEVHPSMGTIDVCPGYTPANGEVTS